MKRTKLIKSLLISAPVVIAPLLASSCGAKLPDDKKIAATTINNNAIAKLTPATTSAKYWVDALAGTLKAEFDSIASDVTSTAAGNNTLDITTQINTAIAKAKNIATDDPSNIDKIMLTFSGTGNINVVKNSDNKYILTVYPSFVNSRSANQTLTTTLSLTLSDSNKNTQTITNTYDVAKGFKNYTDGLTSNDVRSIFPYSDGNTLYAGTTGGLAVGTKANSTYTFANIGLAGDTVYSVFPLSSETVFAGTNKGVAVGTKTGSTYSFKNYLIGDPPDGIFSVYATSDGNTIFAGTAGIGVAVGTKTDDGYTFKIYDDQIASNTVNSIYASADGSKVYVGTLNGFSVGTKTDDGYSFQILVGNVTFNSVYASADGNTVYAGTDNGVEVGTKNPQNTYTFQPYTQGIANETVYSIYASADGNTIYAGTGGGLAIGTKQSGSNNYTFTTIDSGLASNTVYSIYASADGNTIYAGTKGGVSVSSSIWLNQNNLSYSANNFEVIILNNKNYN